MLPQCSDFSRRLVCDACEHARAHTHTSWHTRAQYLQFLGNIAYEEQLTVTPINKHSSCLVCNPKGCIVDRTIALHCIAIWRQLKPTLACMWSVTLCSCKNGLIDLPLHLSNDNLSVWRYEYWNLDNETIDVRDLITVYFSCLHGTSCMRFASEMTWVDQLLCHAENHFTIEYPH
jgi:hypothetical protein